MIKVVTCDQQGKVTGEIERLTAHKNPGKLHLAISVVLCRKSFDVRHSMCEVLLQKRSEKKPLWPGYWANTVCTHPLPEENKLDCAVRRLKEEMGIEMDKKELKEIYSFTYQSDYNQELSEHEYDTVILGEYEGDYKLNPEEAMEARWVELTKLRDDLERHPEIYAPWPKFIFRDERIFQGVIK